MLSAKWLYLPSDQEIEGWAAIDRRVVDERARRKFSLDADQLIHDPIEFHYFSVEGGAETQRGKDKRWRTSQLAATVIQRDFNSRYMFAESISLREIFLTKRRTRSFIRTLSRSRHPRRPVPSI